LKVTIIGGCGAWSAAGEACSGYMVEHDGFRLLIDPGYATLPRLLERVEAGKVSAVLVSHGHPDHCADLNPLLRARVLGERNAPPLPVYSLPSALDAVLALDRPGMLKEGYILNTFTHNDHFHIGPFEVETHDLPHFIPSVGMRLSAGRQLLAYTGDTGPSPDIPRLARDADVLLAEATFPEEVPDELAKGLISARLAGQYASEARVDELILTHLWPGTDRRSARRAAAKTYKGRLKVARPGLELNLR
jgi:ribonuclease BN (tRNA processing enzyme)